MSYGKLVLCVVIQGTLLLLPLTSFFAAISRRWHFDDVEDMMSTSTDFERAAGQVTSAVSKVINFTVGKSSSLPTWQSQLMTGNTMAQVSTSNRLTIWRRVMIFEDDEDAGIEENAAGLEATRVC
jgi:hypothetical protein